MSDSESIAPAGPAPYGYCPICGQRGKTRERRLYGNDTCEAGHVYPSRNSYVLPRLVCPTCGRQNTEACGQPPAQRDAEGQPVRQWIDMAGEPAHHLRWVMDKGVRDGALADAIYKVLLKYRRKLDESNAALKGADEGGVP